MRKIYSDNRKIFSDIILIDKVLYNVQVDFKSIFFFNLDISR